jgi:hypothetical protein
LEVYGEYADSWFQPGSETGAFASANNGWLYLGGQSPAGGEPDVLAVNAELAADQRTGWLELKGDRFIQELHFVYPSQGSMHLRGQSAMALRVRAPGATHPPGRQLHRAGCRREGKTYMLRHSCCYYLADRATELRAMQDYLGHRDPKHTAHYTRVARHRFEGLWRSPKARSAESRRTDILRASCSVLPRGR